MIRVGWIGAAMLLACGSPAPGGDGGTGTSGAGETDGASEGSDDGSNADDAFPGKVVMRRLNRVEYNNTVRDLLGTDLRPADEFPPDEVVGVFDNEGAALAMSPLLVERYERAAEQLAADALQRRALEVFLCEPTVSDTRACLETIARTLGRRAWRRPLTDAEVSGLASVLDLAEGEGQGFEAAVGLLVHALLLSPHFLFRVELGVDPGSEEAQLLSSYEVASRLSYFLWSTMPDEELLDAAKRDELVTPDGVQAQAERMLADARAAALAQNVAGQWLLTRGVASIQRDPVVYPSFTEDLRDAMAIETQLLLEHLLSTDVSAKTLLTARFSFLNEPLAEHYGVAGVAGEDFRRVDFDGDERAGILGHAGILAGTSESDRTSPVKRGKWVLSHLLCSEPPPPPPGVESLPDGSAEGASKRELLEEHVTNDACASCHETMDAIGFGLESYDVVGAWRDEDEFGFPVDAAAELGNSVGFDGPVELGEVLAADPRFDRCVVEMLLAYALGRAVTSDDEARIDDLVDRFADADFRLSHLVQLIVLDESFRYAAGEGQ